MSDSMFVFDKPVITRVSPHGGDNFIHSGIQPANLVLRYIAFLFDLLIVFVLLFFVEIFLALLATQILWRSGQLTLTTLMAGHFSYWGIPSQLITFIFFVFFYLEYSATPGKLALGLRVVDAKSNGDLSVAQIFIREIVGKFYSAFFLGFGFFLAFFRRDQRAFHDLLARSIVVRDPKYRTR